MSRMYTRQRIKLQSIEMGFRLPMPLAQFQRDGGGFTVLQLLAVRQEYENSPFHLGTRLLHSACDEAFRNGSAALFVPSNGNDWWAGASKRDWLRPCGNEYTEKDHLPQLYTAQAMLRWACDEERHGAQLFSNL